MKYLENERHSVQRAQETKDVRVDCYAPQPDLFESPNLIDGEFELYTEDSLSVLTAGMQDGTKQKNSRKSEKYERISSELLSGSNLRQYRFDLSVNSKLNALAESMPNYLDVVDLVESALAYARRCDQPISITPILIDGPPGIGKSYFANRLADALSVPFSAHDMASASSAGSLAGTDSQWSNAEPGDVLETLVNSHHISPVFVLDELDKAPSSGNTLPRAALYALLEPENSRRFRDRCLPVTVNASHIIWIATTNNARGAIESPLLSRFQQFNIAPPSEAQRYALAQALIQKELNTAKMGHVEIEDLIMNKLASMSPRKQKQCIRFLVGKLVHHKKDKLTCDIWPSNMEFELDEESNNNPGIGFFASL